MRNPQVRLLRSPRKRPVRARRSLSARCDRSLPRRATPQTVSSLGELVTSARATPRASRPSPRSRTLEPHRCRACRTCPSGRSAASRWRIAKRSSVPGDIRRVWISKPDGGQRGLGFSGGLALKSRMCAPPVRFRESRGGQLPAATRPRKSRARAPPTGPAPARLARAPGRAHLRRPPSALGSA